MENADSTITITQNLILTADEQRTDRLVQEAIDDAVKNHGGSFSEHTIERLDGFPGQARVHITLVDIPQPCTFDEFKARILREIPKKWDFRSTPDSDWAYEAILREGGGGIIRYKSDAVVYRDCNGCKTQTFEEVIKHVRSTVYG